MQCDDDDGSGKWYTFGWAKETTFETTRITSTITIQKRPKKYIGIRKILFEKSLLLNNALVLFLFHTHFLDNISLYGTGTGQWWSNKWYDNVGFTLLGLKISDKNF